MKKCPRCNEYVDSLFEHPYNNDYHTGIEYICFECRMELIANWEEPIEVLENLSSLGDAIFNK